MSQTLKCLFTFVKIRENSRFKSWMLQLNMDKYLVYFKFQYLRSNQGILRGEYHCTVDLLFDWFGISCTDNFCFYLQNRLIQTSKTGGEQYSDTSSFSIPGSNIQKAMTR
jgi:hypothetical protein